MKILYSHWIFKLPVMRNYGGVVIGRTILFKQNSSRVSASLLRHEMIHQEQMDRHGVLGFYFIYARDFARNLWRLRDWQRAYLAIPFEREAYKRQREKAGSE